jgi:hypothetical protein
MESGLDRRFAWGLLRQRWATHTPARLLATMGVITCGLSLWRRAPKPYGRRRASEDLVETVCRATLEAVRGRGGESTRWLGEATSAAYIVLDEPTWRWLAGRLPRG